MTGHRVQSTHRAGGAGAGEGSGGVSGEAGPGRAALLPQQGARDAAVTTACRSGRARRTTRHVAARLPLLTPPCFAAAAAAAAERVSRV